MPVSSELASAELSLVSPVTLGSEAHATRVMSKNEESCFAFTKTAYSGVL